MKRKVVVILLSIIFLVSGLVSYYFFKLYGSVYTKTTSIYTPSATPTPTPDPYAPKNVLILGYGGAGHEGGVLTDTIILAHIVPKKEEVILISIPRDIWVPIPMKDGSENYKINHAFAIGVDDINFPNKLPEYKGISGGGEIAKNAVGYITNLNVDYFVSVNFTGFKNIIDILGGVNVNVPYSFKDEYYPLKGEEENLCGKTEEEIELITATMSAQLLEKEFKCRYETIEFEKGIEYMDSETALKFVRSRHSETNGGDFARSLRQQALIVAIKNELLKTGSITKIIPILNNLSKSQR